MARTFDGTNDQVAFGSDTIADNLVPFTAYALVRITADVVDERQILTKMNSSYNGKMFLYALGDGGGNNRIGSIITGSGVAEALSAANALTVNTWTVIASTWASGASSPQLYACAFRGAIAELSYATQVSGSGCDDDASATLRIGTRDPLDATFFAGGIADAALWNRVLSAGELAALGRGFSPAVFPRGRVMYSPVDGRHSPEINWNGTSGTVTEAAYLDHPPVLYPNQISAFMTGSSGGGGSSTVTSRGVSRAISRAMGRI